MTNLKHTLKWLSLIAVLVLTFSVQSAVSSSTSSDSDLKVGKSAQIHLPEGVWIGNTLIRRGGTYRARCDHKSAEDHEMVLTRMAKSNPSYPGSSLATNDVVRVQCHVHPMDRKNKRTAVYFGPRNGGQTVMKIVIRGENVEHRFDQ